MRPMTPDEAKALHRRAWDWAGSPHHSGGVHVLDALFAFENKPTQATARRLATILQRFQTVRELLDMIEAAGLRTGDAFFACNAFEDFATQSSARKLATALKKAGRPDIAAAILGRINRMAKP